jgi:hypothetical protein
MCLICRACLLGLRQIAHLETKKNTKKKIKMTPAVVCRAGHLPRRPPDRCAALATSPSPCRRPALPRRAVDLTTGMPLARHRRLSDGGGIRGI